MADLSFRLHTETLELTTGWEPYAVSGVCHNVQLQADKGWWYCSDKTKPESAFFVPANVRETVIDSLMLLIPGEQLCWVKGTAAGTLYEKCT